MILRLLLLLLPLLLASSARASRVWPVQSAAALGSAVAAAEAGDVIELDSGDYTLAAPLHLSRPLTLRSRNRLARAVLRSASPDALVLVVTASQVSITDLIVGAQTSGISDERSLDIYIGAGTQLEPAGVGAYGGGDRRRSAPSLASRAEIAVARAFQIENLAALRKRSAADGDELRALHDVVLRNVDFSQSRSGANVAFARGAYSAVRIEQCTFGRRGASHINALVSVAEARFAGLAVQRCTFAGAAHILLGDADLATQQPIGLNYWPEALAAESGHAPPVYIGGALHAPATYCLDADCAALAPIVDAAQPTAAYGSLAAAAAAGVRRMLLTDDIVVDAPVQLLLSDTVIEGTRSANKAPLITVRSGGALVSRNGALAGVRNVRFALSGAGAAALVYTDGVAEKLAAVPFAGTLLALVKSQAVAAAVADVVLFDGVSFMGDDSAGQAALVLSAPGVRVELEDSVLVQIDVGVLVHRGALAMLDTTVFGAKRAGVLLETSTRSAGLRVSSSSFIGCGVAIETSGSGGIAALPELYVSCSQFLFNVQRDPLVARECISRPTLCSSVLRYNSIISDQSDDAGAQTTSGTALRRLLRQGNNHIENGRKRTDYIYFGAPTHLRFEDDQGRFDGVSAVLIGDSPAAFVLASYAPVVDACFSIDSLGASASVVSDVLEVRSDKLLHTDDALSVRFRTKDRAFTKAQIGIYTVAHLGAEQVLWTQASTSTLRPEYSSWVLDATLGARDASLDKHAHRSVVVALGTPSDAREQAALAGVAASTIPPRVIAKRLCVVCGSSELPPRLLDQFCDGSTDNVRASFDVAYAELGFGRGSGAPRQQPASLYLYGDCTTARCTVPLDHNENLEGTSSTQRGSLRSTATDCADQSAFIDFLPRASHQSSLRSISATHPPGTECAVGVQPSGSAAGPVVAFSTINGALCIDGRSGGLYVNNDIAAPGGSIAVYIGGQFASRSRAPIVFEANVIASGSIVVDGGDSTGVQPVSLERVVFAAGGGIAVHGSALALTIASCKHVAKLDALGADASVVVLASENEWAPQASIALRGQSLLAGANLTGVAVQLADAARLSNVRFDQDSVLTIDAGATSVLINVHFATIGRALRAAQPLAACGKFELAVAGIDLAKSTVFDAAGLQILAPANARALVTDASAYWLPSGERAHCPAGAAVVRSESQCGCPGKLHAPPHIANRVEPVTKAPARAPVAKEQQPSAGADEADATEKELDAAPIKEQPAVAETPLVEEEVDDADSDDNLSNAVLWWVLGSVGALVLLCGIGICVFAACSSERTVAPKESVQVRVSMRQEDEDESTVDEDDSFDRYNLLRKRTPASKNRAN
jgi:hypothetical protein